MVKVGCLDGVGGWHSKGFFSVQYEFTVTSRNYQDVYGNLNSNKKIQRGTCNSAWACMWHYTVG